MTRRSEAYDGFCKRRFRGFGLISLRPTIASSPSLRARRAYTISSGRLPNWRPDRPGNVPTCAAAASVHTAPLMTTNRRDTRPDSCSAVLGQRRNSKGPSPVVASLALPADEAAYRTGANAANLEWRVLIQRIELSDSTIAHFADRLLIGGLLQHDLLDADRHATGALEHNARSMVAKCRTHTDRR